MDWQKRAVELKYQQSRNFKTIYAKIKREFPQYSLTDENIYDALQDYKKRKDFGLPEWPDENHTKVDLGKHKTKEIILNKNGTQTSETWVELYNEEQLKDGDFLLSLHGYDPAEWTVEWAKSTIWQNSSNQDGITDLYASKITVKKRTVDDGIRREDVMALFDELTMGRKLPKAKRHISHSTKLLEPCIFDLHYGKLAWSGETGENYDHRIAAQRMRAVVDDILARTAHISFDTALVAFGNDYFNFNNQSGTTEKGTLQHNDLRWQKCFVKGTLLQVEMIERIADVCNVEFKYVPGNHSPLLEFCAAFAIHCYFRYDDRVNVDFSAATRKYFEYGKCLIGYTHGSEEKNRLYEIMQTEAIEAWGRTKYHEWHTGHLHIEEVKTKIGLKKRTVPSLTGTDAWHYQVGFVGVLAQAQTFIWDRENGVEDILFSNVKRDAIESA